MTYRLRCTSCGRDYDSALGRYLCDACPSATVRGVRVHRGLLEVCYDLDAVRPALARAGWSGPGRGVWRYRELLPAVRDEHIVTLGEGATPLLAGSGLARALGLPRLYLKAETANPTGAFKDRETAVAISVGRSLGARTTACASTGSIAVSAAAYAARAGMTAFTFVPSTVADEKMVQLLLTGSPVVPVDGIYESALAIQERACQVYGWYNLSSAVNPYRLEGNKTVAFELLEAFNGDVPDWIVVPTGGGGLLAGQWKAFTELSRVGLASRLPRLAAIGVEAGAPLAKAFSEGRPAVEPVPIRPTVGNALLSAYTDYGAVALRAVRDSGGVAIAVSDDELLSAQRELAVTEGIFAEPSGAAAVAGLRRLLGDGTIGRTEVVVCLITGSGLRETGAAMAMVERPPSIGPTWLDFVSSGAAGAGRAPRHTDASGTAPRGGDPGRAARR